MSPTIAWAPMIRPPAPRPWIALKEMSSNIESLKPASAEPIRKITIAAEKNRLRPYWSPSFPQSGVETVEASR